MIGGTFSGNKGAASMLQAVIDNLPEVAGPCRFSVLSAYPADDARERPADERVEVVPARPLGVALSLPLAVLGRLSRWLGISPRAVCWTPVLRALARADVVVDVAGIAFVDGRPPQILAYNAILPGLPLLLGIPVVKCSQALGPFERPLNRFLARLVLSRVDRVYARGADTEGHLRELGLHNAEPAADLAFTLGGSGEAAGGERRWFSGDRERDRIVVVPSAVVQGYVDARGGDYVRLMAGFVDALVGLRCEVLIVPHSARPGARASRMNDLPVCRAIHRRLLAPEGCRLVDEALTAHELRAVIGMADLLVTARFHGMVSALATATPVLVTGWSHKYLEVLRQFGLEEAVVAHDELSVERLIEGYLRLREDRPAVRARIEQALPSVRRSAMRNFDAIAALLAD